MSDTIALRPPAVDDASVMAEVLPSPHLHAFTGGLPTCDARLGMVPTEEVVDRGIRRGGAVVA